MGTFLLGRLTRALAVLSVLGGGLGWASEAHAQGNDAAAAQALYDRAVELMAAKSYDHACPKLEEVTRLVPEGIGAKLTLAECYEAAGKLASAWSQYMFVESFAARTGQAERQKLAADKAAALKPRLAKLTIVVPDAVKGLPQLVVTKGGAAIGAAQFGEPVPIDVGAHAIEATAAGKKKWTGQATIPADGADIKIEIPALEDAPVEVGVGAGGGGAGTPPPPESKPTWLFPVGLAVGGVGVAGLGLGAVFGGLAMSKNSDAEAACPAGRCSAEGNDLRSGAGTFADVSTAMFVVGGALAAGGVLMIVLSPTVQGTDDEKPSDTPTAALHFAPNGVSLSGSF